MAARSTRTGARQGGRHPEDVHPDDVEAAARRLGIESLHPEQERVLGDVLAGRDCLMVLPTGFGKSACYQIPSMVLPRPVVVISPLLALMRDQEEKLLSRDVPVVRMDGTVRGKRRAEALERVASGGPLLVMTTPETLDAPDLSDALAKSGIALAAVDEAHCISEWGHDFRPAYRRLGPRLGELGSPPLLALTATATPKVRDSIVKTLHMRDPSVVAASPHRDNLAFEVLPCEGDARARALVRLIRRLRRPGIIYCTTTKTVDEVYGVLRRFKVPATRYHGRMTAKERDTEQTRFMKRGRRGVMVATTAFGLGIDKQDIRYVMHYDSPASLEQYVQEAGRGGRDGRRSNAILLYHPEDRAMHELLLARSRIRPDQLYRLGHALTAYADENRTPTLEALALAAEQGPRIASALLATLEEAGLVRKEGDEIEILCPADSLEDEVRALASQFERLKREDARRLDAVAEYGGAWRCRAVFLREYFGEEPGEECGLCDFCQGRAQRPDSFFAPINAPDPPRRPGRSRKRDDRDGRGSRDRRGRGRGRRRGRRRGGRGGAGEAEAAGGSAAQGAAEAGAAPDRQEGGKGHADGAGKAHASEGGASGRAAEGERGRRKRRGRRGGRRRGRRGGRSRGGREGPGSGDRGGPGGEDGS